MTEKNQPQVDALSQFLGDGNPAEGGAPVSPQEPKYDAALAKRLEETEKAKAALENQLAEIQAKQAKKDAKPLSKEDLGVPYTGPVEMLVHPYLGSEVPVKTSLVDAFLAQGFKRATPAKKK